MIDWVLEAVHEAGAKHVTVIANPHQADVAAHLVGRAELVYQRDPKGTAHALRQIPAGELRGRQVLVVNGDSPLLTAASILKVLHAHQEAASPATIASVEDPSRDDGRVIRNRDGWLDHIVERKDATAEQRASVHEFNVGVYCFDGSRLVEELDKIKDDNKAGEFYLTDVFQHLKPVTIVKLEDPNEAMGVKDRVRLAKANDALHRCGRELRLDPPQVRQPRRRQARHLLIGVRDRPALRADHSLRDRKHPKQTHGRAGALGQRRDHRNDRLATLSSVDGYQDPLHHSS